MKRVLDTEHQMCRLHDVERCISEWLKYEPESGATLYCTFPQSDEPDRDDFTLLEEVQMNIRSDKYPPEVLISFKHVQEMPDFPQMYQWSDMSQGYWYLVARKL